MNGILTTTTAGLTPGKNYYANTKGDLIADSDYAGRTVGSAVDYYTVYDYTHKCYVTMDSKVGLATSTNSLFVQVVV